MAAKRGDAKVSEVVDNLFIIGQAAVIGMLVNPEAEEMAAAVYGIIPLLVLGIVFGGFLAAVMSDRSRRRRAASEDVSKLG